jgi:glutathionyl-hydroquinone reductase
MTSARPRSSITRYQLYQFTYFVASIINFLLIHHLFIYTNMPHHEPSTADGWHGSIPDSFPAEPDRYHLYIGLFCPFAHRVNFVRHLKGLTELIDLSVVMPYPKGDSKGWPGWRFPASNDEYPGATVDRLFGEDYLHKIYFKADSGYKGRYSVPVLWDRKTGTIVCNVRLIPRGPLTNTSGV